MRPLLAFLLMPMLIAPSLGAADDADAVVPGTPYHATGDLECKAEGDEDFRWCAFGVVRHDDGTATVVITLTKGTDRVLDFSDGAFTAGDDPVTTTAANDGFVANVNGREEYRIPYIIIEGDI